MHAPIKKLKQPIDAEITVPSAPTIGRLERLRPSAVYASAEEQIEYLALLRRHRTAVISILCSCLLAGLLYAKLAPKSYKTETVLEITGVNRNFLNTRDVDPNAGELAPDSYLETQLKLLQNEAIVDRVVEIVAPNIPQALTSDGGSREAIIRGILSTAKAKEEGQSNLVRISLIGPDPQLVADTANELTSQYIQQGQNARLAAAAETGIFLKQQLEDAKNKLQHAEDALQEYAHASGIVLTSDSRESVTTEHLREIQQGLAQAQVDHANRQAQIEMARTASIDAVPQVLDDPTIREDRSKLTELRRQLAELSTTMTPSNYRVQKIQAQIQDVEGEMQRHRYMILGRLAVENREAERRQELLKLEYDKQLAVVADQGNKQVRYNMLKHDVDVNLEIYQTMLQRVKEAGVMAALRASNARVVSAAKVPFFPYSPKLSVSMLLAMLIGTIASVLYILISERADNSVRTPGQSEQYIDRPELAVIPRVRLISKASKTFTNSGVNNSNGAKDVPPMLEHWKKADRTFLVEAYRSAGTSILFSRNGGTSPKVLLVTSPHPQCGKTTTTANIAVSLAEGGRRVLVIDGDLRRPTLAPIFGIRSTTEGLTNALDEEEKADVNKLMQSTAFPGVYVLPSGMVKENVAKLLHSSLLESVLNSIRNEFDYILIDAPPLLGLADARILSKFADGVILICRAGRTSIDELDEVRRLLVEDGTHILGTILNGYDLQRERSSHNSSYLRYMGKTPA